jgi:hypothetical protein
VNLGRCEFVPGFFADTVVGHSREVAMAFLDVDLVDSLTPCVIGLWPRLLPGARIYGHDARSLRLAAVPARRGVVEAGDSAYGPG